MVVNRFSTHMRESLKILLFCSSLSVVTSVRLPQVKVCPDRPGVGMNGRG